MLLIKLMKCFTINIMIQSARLDHLSTLLQKAEMIEGEVLSQVPLLKRHLAFP